MLAPGDSTPLTPSEDTISADALLAWGEMRRRQPVAAAVAWQENHLRAADAADAQLAAILQPQRLGGGRTGIALRQRIGFIGSHEGDLLYAVVLHQVFVDCRAGLIVRNHAQHRIRGGGGVKLFREGIGEIDDAVLFGHGAHGGGTVVDIGTHDIVDAVLRHLLHAGDGALGVEGSGR